MKMPTSRFLRARRENPRAASRLMAQAANTRSGAASAVRGRPAVTALPNREEQQGLAASFDDLVGAGED